MSGRVGSVPVVERTVAPRGTDRDAEARGWLEALRSSGREREQAAARLHALLLGAARIELARRRGMLAADARESLEDLAVQSADDALSAILLKLDDYRFESRFTTWAYKFAILEASVRTRRRAWQKRELPIDADAWAAVPAVTPGPSDGAETRERLRLIIEAIPRELSPHQREVMTALVLAEVPIDVLAERLGTTRGALYKTLHDARRKLRAAVGVEHE